MPIKDHPLRYQLANELHARPFPSMAAPCSVVYLAIKSTGDAASRDRVQDLAHLIALLDRYGAPHPQPGATHYSGEIGRHTIKWEQHTEFVTYTALTAGLSERPFDPSDFAVFPEGWVEELPGERITSVSIRVDTRPDDDSQITENLGDWFVAESLTVSEVLDGSAVVAGDFRIDPAGHQRFAVFVAEGTGKRRIGRIIQRICEIETYKTMSMLGFAAVREISGELGALDDRLGALTDAMRGKGARVEETLHDLLDVSVSLEQLTARTAYRFAATSAYEALVTQRIEALREQRFRGRQGLGEFMMRRFQPAMRTVAAYKARLDAMSARATRASDLLRTRVDVERSAQNQKILASMNERSDLQLRLQHTVEGLSVVAVSYYAVSLVAYLIGPAGPALGIDKPVLLAIITLPVVVLVWLFLRRLRGNIK